MFEQWKYLEISINQNQTWKVRTVLHQMEPKQPLVRIYSALGCYGVI